MTGKGSPLIQRQRGQVRARQAMELRLGGHTYETIAEQIGYASPASAYKAVRRALESETEQQVANRDELRSRQAAQIQRLIRGVWPAALRGDLNAVRTVSQLLEREARLFGIDAPVKVEVSERMDAEIQQLMEELAGNDAADKVVNAAVESGH